MEENVGGGGFRCTNWAAAALAASSSASSFPHQHLVGPTFGGPHFHNQQQQQQQPKQQHLTCLKLGKRQYYGGGDYQAETGAINCISKRERSSAARCQVEGCNGDLSAAKEYHRRHKVCQMHSKAPKVVVQGAEQRFCQQCSRFHVISEFDDSKRSCRRRLAGHNERRRKSSSGSSSNGNGGGGDLVLKNSTEFERTVMGGSFSYLSETSPGHALSLLSLKGCPWISPELSYRSSVALHELIAENRASLIARQLLSSRGWQAAGQAAGSMNQSIISFASDQNQNQEPVQGTAQLLHGWNQFQESGCHLTLDLMQSANSSSFEFLSERNKSKEAEEECCEIWKSLTHVV